MMLRKISISLLMIALLVSLSPVQAGGWAVVTLDAFPLCVVAGDPVEVGFVVRQHGVHVLEGLKPVVEATQSETGDDVEFEAEEDTPGHYIVELDFAEAGEWEWSFNAFGPLQPMPLLDVLPAGTNCKSGIFDEDNEIDAEEAEANLALLGQILFVAKGCAVCHQHDGADFDPYASINAGPELTQYDGSAPFLRVWLADPQSVEPETYMPALGLHNAEIDALIAFLTAE